MDEAVFHRVGEKAWERGRPRACQTRSQGRAKRRKAIGVVVGAVVVGCVVSVAARWPERFEGAAVPSVGGEVPSAPATGGLGPAEAAADVEGGDAMEVLVFSSSDCPECRVVRERVIPQLRVTFGSAIRVRAYDLSDGSSYAALVEQERRVGSQEAVTAKLFVGGRYLAGVEQIAGRAIEVVQEALVERRRKGA